MEKSTKQKKSIGFKNELYYKQSIQYLLNYYTDFGVLPQYSDYIKKGFFKSLQGVHPFIKKLCELDYLQIVKGKYIPGIKLRVHVVQNSGQYLAGPYGDILKSMCADNNRLSENE